ncbi:MAG: DNA repair protein RadC [Candidatus Roizmanbacteria bacterium]|nr:DNA repair protein RadC [Candidatus Roizmanbacteria bacterium]
MIIKLQDAKVSVASPKCVFELLKAYFKTLDDFDQDKEHFFVFHLDIRNKIKIMDLVSVGTLTQSLAHPREVFTRVIHKRTPAIILAHNHPSGETSPSYEDISITKRLCEAGKILSTDVIDHIIFTDKEFYSFKEHELI